jgi:hypothetical protein
VVIFLYASLLSLTYSLPSPFLNLLKNHYLNVSEKHGSEFRQLTNTMLKQNSICSLLIPQLYPSTRQTYIGNGEPPRRTVVLCSGYVSLYSYLKILSKLGQREKGSCL